MPSCNLCHYDFKCNYDLNKHFNTKKHKEKLNSGTICTGCFKEFSTKFNKSRHEQKCNRTVQNITNIETQNITNVENQNITNIENQNITETKNNINNITNIILLNNPEEIKSFVMTISDLQSKKTTDCFQKLILDDMISKKYDLMDYVEKFDREVDKARADIVNEHNRGCWSYINVKKINDSGQEYEEEVEVTPLTHPDRKWSCRHAESEFKVNEDKISEILAKTLLDEDKLVVTHDNNINGLTDLLFKHERKLHSDDILMEFVKKSNKQQYFNLSEDFKPTDKLKEKYPEFYSKIEAKAIDVFRAYNKKIKQSSRRR